MTNDKSCTARPPAKATTTLSPRRQRTTSSGASPASSPSSRRHKLTIERLRETLDYDPETGHFTHKRRPETRHEDKRWNTRYAGKRAGYLHKPSGYWLICVDNVKYKAHRLAHVFVTGEWPAATIDHRSGKRADNRWTQLRPATIGENCRNKSIRRDNTSDIQGVSFASRGNYWRAYINLDGVRIERRRKTREAAIAVRLALEEQYHGEFRRAAA